MRYDRKNPFIASVKERYSLCRPGSCKETLHVVLDLQGSGIQYRPGDSIAVFPENPKGLVENTLRVTRWDPELVLSVKNEEQVLKEFLSKKANLCTVPKKVIELLEERQTDEEKKKRLAYVLENRDALKAYQENHELWDALEENEEVFFSAEELCNLLMPQLPRFYSISSSMREVGDEVHLTIASLNYETNGHARVGICTYYLCEMAPLNQAVVPLYVQPTKDFLLPKDANLPIIMVGPGTGIAPFRAFMQEREAARNSGKNWLFFGEWNREQHFFYEEYWQDLVKRGRLRLDLAFSRDKEHKVYVQHRMLEKAAELFRWLEEGAIFYVCGDAQKMAKDVETALIQIVQEQGGFDEEATKEYIKNLRKEKRYIRDIY